VSPGDGLVTPLSPPNPHSPLPNTIPLSLSGNEDVILLLFSSLVLMKFNPKCVN
jgi:hypothetical protein